MVDYPQDWKEVDLINIANTFIGLVTTMTSNYTNDGAKLIRNQDIQNNKFIFKENIYLKKEFAELNKSRMHKFGDVVTVHTGDIGTSAVIEESLVGSLGFATIVTRLDKKIADPYFISCYFNSKRYKDYVMSIMTGDGRNNLNMRDFNKTRLILPSLAEQKVIAETLMAFDRHIENLESLIEKKKMIRDGAVEDLMTGKTRLEGFEGEWIKLKLEDICVDSGMIRGPFGGSLKKEYFVNKGYKVYEQKNAIYKSVDIGNYYIDTNKFEELKRFEIKEDDFIVSCSGTIGEIYRIPNKFKKGIINQALLKLSLNTNLCDLRFFNIYFNWERFKSKLIDDTQGGAMKNLVGMDKFRITTLVIPADIKEQEAIASILTSMDEEIENLEKEKAKIEKIKAGAMDDLLTGRVRLI